ncbi:MAG: 30S ribosomal protein S6 [Negativicoccus massiliensis]|uniref:30S ribosomal protein S6 n=1 Tax=Negativicoccus succinicivorans TaxID=620903 RepID=UPI0026E91C19|nr:30S ribosomal protein S6 [Negativicoccus succinicivorans]MBS5887299.1 30S ribosomal protein S6 [Negativicoccus succinicivorans]MDU3215047.1 30S ribosomal protein S6 [Negativicoccus succinicivorans]MDU4641169.1 30S ribosomal protein S6 [Negativicoccus massiliensis]MDU5026869.1 30S ribosomal protein S6 [Negativicoccus succinicivorans]
MNKNYEVMFIINAGLDEEAADAIVKRVEDLITKNGGTVNNIDRMGKRRLAYEVKKQIDGNYVLIEFAIDPAQIKEIDRVIKINEKIIRHLIVKQDK